MLGYDSENQKKLSFEELLESQEIYEPPGTPPCLPDEPPIDEEEEGKIFYNCSLSQFLWRAESICI